MPDAYVALGSNVGARRDHLDHALARLGDVGEVTGGSPIYETEPVGGSPDQGAYLNAVVRIATELAPRDLLAALLAIEAERGRTREGRWEARTLDLDLLRYGDLELDEPGLTVPHPEIRNRAFVLAPLTDLEPGLDDEHGSYVEALTSVGWEGIRRVSGPVDLDGHRWMVGLADALDLAGEGPFHCVAHPDWSNTSHDAFGGFLSAVALAAGHHGAPGFVPADFGYRFIAPVPSGASIDIDVSTRRATDAAREFGIRLTVDGVLAGICTLSMVRPKQGTIIGPACPSIMGRFHAVPADRLVRGAGRTPGASIRSWTPLERWDMPDMVDGTEQVLRAWSPNVAFGSGEPHLVAASILMPIDALIWPATLQARGSLPAGELVFTPTIDLTVRYARIIDRPWFVGEASIDHVAGRSVAGTVRVWNDDGTYAAVGHSLNLVLDRRKPTDGV